MGSDPFFGEIRKVATMPEQGVGCVWIFFRPSQTAEGIAARAYVDIGFEVDAKGNLIRPEKNPDTSHTPLLHREAARIPDWKRDPTPFQGIRSLQ
jgi:hypothetical protein